MATIRSPRAAVQMARLPVSSAITRRTSAPVAFPLPLPGNGASLRRTARSKDPPCTAVRSPLSSPCCPPPPSPIPASAPTARRSSRAAHPLLGADHLLTMVAVGLFAAMTGGRARWACPAAFVGAMRARRHARLRRRGAARWSSRRSSPRSWCSARRSPSRCARRCRWPAAAIALFGVAHGYAHGLEGPALGGLPYAARLRRRDGRAASGSASRSASPPAASAARRWRARSAGLPASPASRWSSGEGADDPGEVFPAAGDITLNDGREAVTLTVANTGDRPIQVGSHYHFAETQRRARLRPRRRPRPAARHPGRHRGALRAGPDPRGAARALRRRPAGLRLQRAGHGSRSNEPPSTTPAPASAAPSPSRPRSTSRSRRPATARAASAWARCSPSRRATSFTLLRGEDALTEYTFNRHVIRHQFCTHLRHPDLRLRQDAGRHARWWRSTATASTASTRGRSPSGTSTAARSDARVHAAGLACPPASARSGRRGHRPRRSASCRSPSSSWRWSPTSWC